MYGEEKRYRYEKCLPKDVTPVQSKLIKGLYTNNKKTALNRILQEMTMSTQAPTVDPVSNSNISDSGEPGIESERRFQRDIKSEQYTRVATEVDSNFNFANNANDFRTANNNNNVDMVASSDPSLMNDDVFIKNATTDDAINSVERGSFSNSPNSLVECESTLCHDGVSSTTENSRNDAHKSGTVRLKTLIEKALENSLNTKNKKNSQTALCQQNHVKTSDNLSSSWITHMADDSKKGDNSKIGNDMNRHKDVNTVSASNNNKNSVCSIQAHIEHVLEAHIKTGNSPELTTSPPVWTTNVNSKHLVAQEKFAPKLPERQCSTSSGNSESSFSVEEFVDKVISQTEVISRILTQPTENDNKDIRYGCDNLDIRAPVRLISPQIIRATSENRYPPRMLQASEHLKSHHYVNDKTKFPTGARECGYDNVGARDMLKRSTKETFERKHATQRTDTRILKYHAPVNVNQAVVTGNIPYVSNGMSPGVIPANYGYYRPRANTHSDVMRQAHVDKGTVPERSLSLSHPARRRQSPSTLGFNTSPASGAILSAASPHPSLPTRSDHLSPTQQHGLSKLSPPAPHIYHLENRPVARDRTSVHSSSPEEIRREGKLIPGPYLADQNGNSALSPCQDSVGNHKFVHGRSDKGRSSDFPSNLGEYTIRKPEYNSLSQVEGLQSHSSVRREHIQQRPPSMPNLCMEHARPNRTVNMDNGRYLIQPMVASDPVSDRYRHDLIDNAPETRPECHPLDLSLKKSTSPPLKSKSHISEAYRHMTIKSHLESRVPIIDDCIDKCVRKEAMNVENVGIVRVASNFSASPAQIPNKILNGNPSNPMNAMTFAAPVKSGYAHNNSNSRDDLNAASYPQTTPFSLSEARLDVISNRGPVKVTRTLEKSSGSKSSAVSKHEPVQSILGNHDPDDVLFLLCKLCEQTYGSPYGFRKHFRNRHGFEPQSHHALIQSIAATKSALRVPVGIPECNADPRMVASSNINQSNPGPLDPVMQHQTISPRDSKYTMSISPPMASPVSDKLKVISSNTNSDKLSEKPQPNRDVESDETRYLVCPECRQNFQLNDFGLYKKHCRAHERSRQNFNTAQETAKHIAKRQFYCKRCNASFTSYALLSQHLSSFHPESNMDDKYKCTHCGMVFEKYSAFSEHMLLHGLSTEQNNVPKIALPAQLSSVQNVQISPLREVMLSPILLVSKTESNIESLNTSESISNLTPSPQFFSSKMSIGCTNPQESTEICREENSCSSSPSNKLEIIHDPSASQISPMSINSKEDTDEGPPKLEIVETVYRHKKFCSSHGKRKGLDPPSLEMIGTKKMKRCSNIFDDGSDDQHDARSPTTSVTSLSMSTSLSISPGAISEAADTSLPVSASTCESDTESSPSGTKSVGVNRKKSPKSEAKHQLPFVWDRVTRRQAGKNIKPPDYIQ